MSPSRRADLILGAHLLAVAFALFGGLLLRVHPLWAWLHGPVALWFALVNLADWTCPLTTLEKRLRGTAPGEGYTGGFVEHYLGRFMGSGWTRRGLELASGLFFLAWNVLVYGWVFRGWVFRGWVFLAGR